MAQRWGQMPDELTEVIQAAIRSAFVAHSREDDPDWRSESWIKPDECAHLTDVLLRELDAKGFRIVKTEVSANRSGATGMDREF